MEERSRPSHLRLVRADEPCTDPRTAEEAARLRYAAALRVSIAAARDWLMLLDPPAPERTG